MEAGGWAVRLAGLLSRELEWNDARNGSKNLIAAPPHRRPHARIDPRALCFARATPRRSPAARGPRAGRGGPRPGRAGSRLGSDLRQGVRAGGEGTAGAAHALRQMAAAELL